MSLSTGGSGDKYIDNKSTEDTVPRVVVVGGGAAGFFSAIQCAQHLTDHGVLHKVVVLEAGRSVLSKVLISGGGRCNVMHDPTKGPDRIAQGYPRGHRALLGPLHRRFGPWDAWDWFSQRLPAGVHLKTEQDGRVFPSTDSSQTIAAALRSAAEQLGVEVQCGARVQSITTVECPAPALVARHTVERDGEAGETAQEGPGPRRFSVAYTTRAVQSSPASPTASPSTRTSASSPSAPTLTSLECDRVIVATGSARQAYDMLSELGHCITGPLPSLFSFKLAKGDGHGDGVGDVKGDFSLTELAGASVPYAKVRLLLPKRFGSKSGNKMIGRAKIPPQGEAARSQTTVGAKAARIQSSGGLAQMKDRNMSIDIGSESAEAPVVNNKAQLDREAQLVRELSAMSAQMQHSALEQRGPLLVTKQGLSGPAVLRLSAYGAKVAAALAYRFEVEVSLLGDLTTQELAQHFAAHRESHPTRSVGKCFPHLSPELLRFVQETGSNAGSEYDDCLVENLAQERMPELFVSANDYSATDSHGGQAGRQAERGKWRSRVPELRDLQHPLMHRVLLGIVRLIKLFSLNSQNDTTGLLKNVADLLNDQGREKLLIGPATGLVMCPDFDVKIQCLQVIEHVLETSPQQLSPEEMGWLMQYLTSAGLGLGKQEEFLMEVVHLITLLVSDQTKAGHTFRHRFAKLAIRESFEILRLNSRREVKGEAEQESKKGVSLKTIQLLQVSSQPLSGGLRKFLRRVDFLTCLKEVLVEEDRDDRPGIQAAVLSTWTGRNMREVLLPMVGGSDIRPRGRGRYHALVRLADVLQGRSDRVPGSKLQAVPPSDERDFWPSVATMLRVENDQMEEEDWTNQQRVFVTSAGVSQLLKFAERYLTGDVAVERFRRCQSLVESFGIASSQKVKRWWEDRPASHEDAKSGEDARINEKHLSAVEECFMTRLRIINQRVSELYGYNLNVYDEGRGSSLVQLAKDLAKHFTESQEMHRKYYEMHPYEYEALMKRENEYLVGSRLMSIRAAMKRGLRLEKPRQPHGDLKRLLEQAAAAHQYLKGVLIARHPHNDKDAEEWARSHLERGKEDVFRRRIGPKGLALFLRNHEAQVIDPGVEPQQTILRKHAFKYFNDNTRVRNAVRLIIEYPDAGKLNASLKEIVHAGAFSVVRIRNRFALPSNLARRCVAVNIEIQLAEVKHMAELELVIRHDAVSTQDTLARESMLMDTLEKSLRDSCQVKAKAVEQVAEFLCNEVESRSMRHCDAVILKCGESNLEVQREEVVVQSDVFNADQTFILEREGGIGVVKSGDVISLKCKQTGLYLDMTSNGNLRCRFGDAMSQQSNLRFIIEIDLLEEEPSGVAGGLVGWFGGDALAQTQGRAHKGAHGAPVTNLHTGSRIKIKAKGSNRYITVMSGATYLGLAGEKRRVKGHPLEDNNAEGQTLSIIREGAMQEYLNLDGTTDAAQQPGLADAVSAEERHEHLLLEAHMCTALPSLDSCPREGGVFRSAPPAFRVVAQRQAQAESRHETVSSDEDKSSLDSELSRMPLVISAILRCNYVLIEFPESPSTRNHALGQILAGALGSTSRYLVATMTVQHALHSDTPEEEPDIISAWLPAKLLRLFSAALSHVPALCANPDRREETSEDIREREKAAARERKKAERGEYDQKRVELLDIIAQYMSQMLIQSLLVRLSVVTHRSLSIQEVVLLRELATLVDRMVYNFFSNELRCVKKHRNGQKQEPTPPQLQQGGDQPPARPADQAAALEDDAAGGAVGMLGLMFADESVPKLSRETEAEIFASMVPRATTHVLVQAMLYAVHQEAIAFTAGFKTHDLTVRLISSLANRSISALSAVMHGRSGSEATACEFHICESVSQAMSHGAQLVPRARIMQLMEERAIDKLRGTMEELMQDGDFDPGLPDVPMTHSVERPVAKSTERIVVIARCWAGPVDEAHLTLPRCLVAVTSRMNLAVVSLPPDATGTGTGTDQLKVGGPPPSKEELDVVSFRDLRRLQRTVVSGKMRQFLGLWWDDSEDCQREVLIFDSSSRRRAFQQVLRMVEGASRRDQRRGVPSVELRSEVRDVLQETCKRDNRNNTALVNVSFVRSRTRAATSSWSETWTGSSDHAQPEVLLMTVDTVAVITLTSFLQKYARADDAQAYASLAHGHALLDTDSEDEEDPGQYKQPGQAGESVVKCQTLYSSPWQLKQLEGVWFLAEAEPRIKLRFERTEEFLFSSDGERQRWRRHLAVVLANQERRQQDDRARNQGWSVLATGKTEIADVRQYAMTHAHRSLDRSLGAEQPRALTNATKAAG